ncbi:MAG: hypothetical protein OEY49_01530 [Candidatus Heimdallarchaeota archaeon]|nr:hypothetical protein [Candidatus Heimdallarchaeota archaeon]
MRDSNSQYLRKQHEDEREFAYAIVVRNGKTDDWDIDLQHHLQIHREWDDNSMHSALLDHPWIGSKDELSRYGNEYQ